MMFVIDSGLGGLSVVRAIRAIAPQLPLAYMCDTAGFPYGKRSPEDITARGVGMIAALSAVMDVRTVVVACNTLSTLALAALRAQFPHRFVGTVPAIKIAAQQSATRRFTLLATPNTAHSAYSAKLIAEFASDCVVDCYGAPQLAAMAEAIMLGEPVTDAALAAEIAPAFLDDKKGKTDAVVLGCTHYPLILGQLQRVAPWPVTWIDSAHAIARQALSQPSGASDGLSIAYVTDAAHVARYAPLFAAEGFAETRALHLSC